MQSGNNIHVQQHKTNMINEEWNKTQNDAPFFAFYDMHAVTFALPDKNKLGLTGQLILIPNPIYIKEKKYRIWNKNYPAC